MTRFGRLRLPLVTLALAGAFALGMAFSRTATTAADDKKADAHAGRIVPQRVERQVGRPPARGRDAGVEELCVRVAAGIERVVTSRARDGLPVERERSWRPRGNGLAGRHVALHAPLPDHRSATRQFPHP